MAGGQRAKTSRAMAAGIASALLGACAWGFSGTCVQFLFATTAMDSLVLTFLRELGAGLVFLLVLCMRDRARLLALVRDRDSLRRLAVFGTFGLFLNSAMYATTIAHTNAGTATVLQSLNIVLALAVTCAQTRRRPRTHELAALALALAAVYLIATHGDPRGLQMPVAGLVFGLITACTATFYTMYPRPLFERWGSFPVTGMGMLQGGITGLVVCAASGRLRDGIPIHDATGAAVLAVAILVGTFGAYGLFLHGVSVVGPVAGNMLGAAEPVSATVICALWLKTPFVPADWAALVLMVATILLVALGQAQGATTRR